MKDPYGFTTVDLEKVGYKEEPFVLADQVSQVFYVHDTRNKKRHVVLPRKRWVVSVENVVDEEYNQFDEVPPFGSCNIPVLLDCEKTLTCGAATRIKGSPRQRAAKQGENINSKMEDKLYDI